MGKSIRIFLNGIANSLNPDGYNNIVSPTKKLGESASRISDKREKNYRRISKVTDVRTAEITAG